MSDLGTYKKCFIETFGVEENILANLEYQSVSEWDSVGHMTLITVFEDCFDIEMDIDDITEFSSFKAGKEILAKYGVKFD